MKKFPILIFLLLCLYFISFAQPAAKGISNALEFDGTDDFVNVAGGTALLANLDEFSMCGWVYATNPNAAWPDFDGFFGIKNEFTCDFYIAQINGTGVEARITTNVGTFTIDPPLLSAVSLNEWHHYALVYTGTELQLFLDGELDGSVGAIGQITLDYLDLTFGKLVFGTNDFYLDGKLDEITFWSKALTSDEILQYQCIDEDPSGIDDLTAYYDFNEETGLILPDYFENYNGDLTNMAGDEWVVSEVCESGYTITFIVTDEITGNPVENAQVNLEGLLKSTDEFGLALFTNYDPGTYVYEVTHPDYYESAGEVEVIDADLEQAVVMAPVLYYNITFLVTESVAGGPAIDSAIVNLDGTLKYTDETGLAVYENYLPGNYVFNVSKEGYTLFVGNLDIIDEDVAVEVILNPTSFDIVFQITEEPGGVAADSALVDLDGEINYTDETGMALFENYLPGSYPYTISKYGYALESGTAVVTNEDLLLEITLLIDRVRDRKREAIQIFPNPTSRFLYLGTPLSGQGTGQASLFDLRGRVAFHQDRLPPGSRLDLQKLIPGIYLLQVRYGDTAVNELIVIQ